MAASAIAVLAGEALVRVVPPIWIHRAAGLLFVGMGLLMLFAKPDIGS